MSSSDFNLNYTNYDGINLNELRLLAENTIILENEYKQPIYKKLRNYKKDIIKANKKNKKVNKLCKKIEKLKNKIAELRGIKL